MQNLFKSRNPSWYIERMKPIGDEKFYILAGTSAEYTTARQKLGLIPKQAFWLTRPSLLKDLEAPKVYRYGSWKNLAKLEEIEVQIEASKATVSDID